MTSDRLSNWIVRIVAGLAMLNGILALYRPLAEHIPERVENFFAPVAFDYFGRSLDLLIGVTLLYFSYQLLRRRVVAWWMAVFAAAVLVIVHSVLSRSYSEVVVPALSLAALILTKDQFRAKSEPTDIRQGVLLFAASVLLAVTYGTVGFYLLRRSDFGFVFSLKDAIGHSLRAYLQLGNPDLHSHTRHARWFLYSLSILGAVSIYYGLYSLFRPLAYRLQTLPEERDKLQRLLERYSHSSEDFFKLWPHDKSYFFSDDSNAAIAYGVSGGVALGVGDPVGSDENVEDTIGQFDELCLRNGWLPAHIYVGGHYLTRFREHDYELLKVGEDAVVTLSTFASETVKNKHFRNVRNRFQKDGYSVELHHPPHLSGLLDEIASVSRDWMQQPDRKEWSFLAGSFSRQYMQQCPLFVARDGSGRIQAFANQIPSFLDGYATIDLMRHRRDAPNGMMDYLLSEVMLQLESAGFRKFNLGMAPLSGLGGEAGSSEEKLLDLIYRSNQKFLSLKGLRQFKSKFEPVWEPKYVAYSGSSARLPQIALALSRMMQAHKL